MYQEISFMIKSMGSLKPAKDKALTQFWHKQKKTDKLNGLPICLKYAVGKARRCWQLWMRLSNWMAGKHLLNEKKIKTWLNIYLYEKIPNDFLRSPRQLRKIPRCISYIKCQEDRKDPWYKWLTASPFFKNNIVNLFRGRSLLWSSKSK